MMINIMVTAKNNNNNNNLIDKWMDQINHIFMGHRSSMTHLKIYIES